MRNPYDDLTKLHCIAEESAAPYEDGDCPFPYTEKDEQMIRQVMRKLGIRRKDSDERDDLNELNHKRSILYDAGR
jgi:hypothetical protein